jgi:hypothetical protein
VEGFVLYATEFRLVVVGIRATQRFSLTESRARLSSACMYVGETGQHVLNRLDCPSVSVNVV